MGLFFCPLFSGSSGNATFIATEDTAILVDAGVSCKRIGQALENVEAKFSDLSAVIITHEHIDHIKAIGVMARRHGVPIYANEGTWSKIMEQGRVGEIPMEQRICFDRDFFIGDLAITPMAIPHDAAQPVGFSIYGGGVRVLSATDMGYMPKQVLAAASGADIIMMEFNHDVHMLQNGAYPHYLKKRILSRHGHLSNDDAAIALKSLVDNGSRRFMLGHLSKENNTPEAAYDSACAAASDCGATVGVDVEIEVAPPVGPGKAFIL